MIEAVEVKTEVVQENQLEPELICSLHSKCYCTHRAWDKLCTLKTRHAFIKTECPYVVSTIVDNRA